MFNYLANFCNFARLKYVYLYWNREQLMAKFFRQILAIFTVAILPVSLVNAANTQVQKSTIKKHIVHKKVILKLSSGKVTKRYTVINGEHAIPAHLIIERLSAGDIAGLKHADDPLALQSNVAFVVDQSSSQVLFEKNSHVSLPIASITKLMTSLVVVESNQNMNEIIEVTTEDLDREKGTGSRLVIGAKLSRADMLHIALMSSENRAASALGRNYIGGLPAFVAAMNAKAKQLGMTDTRYVDSSGLSSQNVASARDLVKLINAAYLHPVIREYSTDSKYVVSPNGRPLHYSTTNKLVSSPGWEIGLQKTGYISEAGRCLVMQAMIEGRAVVMVFLDSKGKYSRLADAGRIRKWLETLKPQA
jgi:D-alanyl-D-alanine endopeptidase (penicillin-binding protein 7)